MDGLRQQSVRERRPRTGVRHRGDPSARPGQPLLWLDLLHPVAVGTNDYPSSCEDPEGNDFLGTGDCWTRFDFDQTHILSAQGGYDLPFDFGVSAQVQYVTGNPFSPSTRGSTMPTATSTTASPWGRRTRTAAPFVQTSLPGDKRFTFKSWQLEAYVDLLNVVRGVNPEFTLYNYDFSEYAYVRGLPFIPNIGIEAEFFP